MVIHSGERKQALDRTGKPLVMNGIIHRFDCCAKQEQKFHNKE